MARNIFNQPPKSDTSKPDTSPAPASVPAKSAKMRGSVGGLRDSLREITANSIRDIDPSQINTDGLRDRLLLEDASIDELAESIRKHGQQVPIMIRPSDQSDQYRIIYGRRRLAAVRKIGGTVKAIVRTLDDDASLIAQGQENNLRLDPSFIEKALFIKEMSSAGYKPGVIQDALGLSRQGVSNHRVVIDQLPTELIHLIGPAHGIGRRQWADLASLSGKVDLLNVANAATSDLSHETTSADKFQAVYSACLVETRSPAKASNRSATTVIKDEHGGSRASLTVDDRSVALKFARKDNPEFSHWIEDRAEVVLQYLFEQWQNERGSGS
jgi:ParB family chromosome partitioning protein